MDKDNIDLYSPSDLYYLEMIGDFIKTTRSAQNRTQADLAFDAGINRTTLSQMEQGNPVNLLSLIQVLRALKQLHILKEMEPKVQISPLKQAELELKKRQRVRPAKGLPSNRKQSDW